MYVSFYYYSIAYTYLNVHMDVRPTQEQGIPKSTSSFELSSLLWTRLATQRLDANVPFSGVTMISISDPTWTSRQSSLSWSKTSKADTSTWTWVKTGQPRHQIEVRT